MITIFTAVIYIICLEIVQYFYSNVCTLQIHISKAATYIFICINLYYLLQNKVYNFRLCGISETDL